MVRRAAGPRLRVTALNSTPVIFYPTDTFAELKPCSPETCSFPEGNVMHASLLVNGRLNRSATVSYLIHMVSKGQYSGHVVSAVLETY